MFFGSSLLDNTAVFGMILDIKSSNGMVWLNLIYENRLWTPKMKYLHI
jgi:hypothetical protein